jgi:hypothetical protein
MWITLQHRPTDASHQMTCTAILWKFQATRYLFRSSLSGVDVYFAKLKNSQHQLSGLAEEITDNGLITHIVSSLMGHFYTTVCIMQWQRNSEPSAKEFRDSSRDEANTTKVNTELGDPPVGSAPISHQTGYCGSGRGSGYGRGCGYYCGNHGNHNRGNDSKFDEYSCTQYSMNNHTTENCGILKRQSSYTSNSGSCGFSNDDDDKWYFHCGKPGHIKSECHTHQRGRDAQNQVTKRRNGNWGSTTAKVNTAHSIIAGEGGVFWLPNAHIVNSEADAESIDHLEACIGNITYSFLSIAHSNALLSTIHRTTWIIYSGASHHMCNNQDSFHSYKRLPSPITIKLGDKTTVIAIHFGFINII